ncbi:GumC family protein [Cerasicoccus fimbriatus]|uniref:GumC family protein n=1 Tax=Cerasicoccus fimbriatus TaxID=3014554 RepID=UPI0022B43C03|nr:polysaccharide biosynthesis tyrosine autokinase [Cerasicoccus sp. TK19100]
MSNKQAKPSLNPNQSHGGLAIPAPVRNWRDYLLMIRERWLIGVSLGLLCACLFAFFALKEPSLYRSTASLLIESKADRVVDIAEVVDNTVRNSTELRNHLSQMRSRSFTRRVIDSFTEKESARITQPYDTPESKGNLGSIASNISIGLPEGQVFYFTSTHRDPEMAALIANRYVTEYIQYLLERTTVGETSANQFLQAQADKLKEKVQAGEKALEDFRRSNDMISLDESQNVIATRLTSLNAALTTARVEKLQVETQLQQVEEALDNNSNLLQIPVVNLYGNVNELVEAQQSLKAEREILEHRYLERHPKMIDNENRMKANQSLIDEAVNKAIADLRAQLAGANRKFSNLQTEMTKAEQESLDLDELRIVYNGMRREVDSDRQLYQQILSRMNETTISAQLDNTNIRILDEAAASSTPFAPDRKAIITKAVGIFFIVAIGVPILLELVNNRLHGYWDVHVFLQRELLGEVPRSNRIDPEKLPYAIRDDLNDSISESFRVLYGQISMLSEREFPKSLLITSTVPGEGKSTVAANLAFTFAKHGKKVLIVDFDLRRPVLHRFYKLENEKGLLNWWNSKKEVQECIPLKTNDDLGIVPMTDNLSLLPSSGTSKNATEMLSSPRFEELLFQLKKEYDLVLFDTPPAGIFVETLQLGEIIDEVVYIARQNAVNRNKAKRVLQDFDRIGVTVLGVILNSVKGAGAQRYGYYGYSYSSTDYVYRYYQRRDRKERKQSKSDEKPAKKDKETIAS